MSSVEKDVRAFIQDNLLFGDEMTFSDEDSFLEEGIIDSTGILELIHFLEERYGFYIEDEELVPENLDSVNRLGKYVRSKCEPPQ
ncbi:MAG: acyl carrier protein [Deltaproteobacteria bacterium]|nr:acyl carrier protein [Deltaproteobacteria bacterium]